MADGQYRFSQATGQQYYNQYNNTRHLHQRPTSPAANHRRGFPSDTPSPSRSPGARSPSNLPYSMYTQSHAALNSHGMMNGGGHQRFGNQLNLNKQYPHHNPHQHNQHGQSGQDGGHGGHQGNFISHQHNQSGGAAGHFGTSHLQNGTQNNAYTSAAKSHSEHWQKQMEIATEIRGLTHAHPHARNASTASKSVLPGSSIGNAKDQDKGEVRYRTQGDWSDDEAEQSIWTEIDMGGSNLRCISVQLFDYYPFLTKLYLNNNRLVSIPPEVGQLRNLAHLDLSLNQITTLPPEMGMLVNLRSLLLVDNKIEVIPYELGNLFALDMLAVDGNPLNEEQLSIIVDEGPQALIKQLRESAPAPDLPNERDMLVLDDTEAAPGEKFKVISFNILCKLAATPQQFGYTPSHALSWDYRKEVILREIIALEADIVCLQEMDYDNYNNLFREKLAHKHFKGVYWPRGKSKTMTSEQIKQVDGCATFINNDKFIILDKQLIDFPAVGIQKADMKGEADLYNRVMVRDNIGVVVFLENRETGSRLIVVNTHLYWDQNYRDVKVVQAAILMQETQRMAESYAKWPPTPDKDKVQYRFSNSDKEGEPAPVEKPPKPPVPSMSYERGTDIPIVVCGDFNSTPRSGVFEMLTTGQLAGNHKDLGNYKYGDITKHGVRHAFGLKSSYGNIGELPFTNYTPGFTGVLDYILYSTSNLSCTALLGEVDPEYLKRVPGFPNAHYPSDHLLLLSEFKSKSRKERKVTEVDFGPQKDNRRS